MRIISLIYLLCTFAVNARSPCDEVPFVNRTSWGAREPTSITNLTGKPLSFYVIHHSFDPPSCYDDQTCTQRVRSIQNFHLDERKWADIGYHFLVGENGKVYEGRGWDRQGAHSPGFNNDGYGICIIGDFSSKPPNETALNAVRLWMACGIEQGHIVKDNYIITHRQSQRPGYTECPGNGTMSVVKTWPRFCSFQNSGANLTGNDTQVSLARRYCQREFQLNQTKSPNSTISSTIPNQGHYRIPIFLNLFLIKITCFLFHYVQ